MALGITETNVPFSPAKGKRFERDTEKQSLWPWRPLICPPRLLLPCLASSILKLRENKNPSNDDTLCNGSPVSCTGEVRNPVEVAAARQPVLLVPWLLMLVLPGSTAPGITCYGPSGSVLIFFFLNANLSFKFNSLLWNIKEFWVV